ncbi:MAG: L-histidine N(alpha)-methyltransferase [Gloeobacterales cyanobacterium]
MLQKELYERLYLEQLLQSGPSSLFERDEDVVKGLSQVPKTLPPRYFYDDRGSELFEQICSLPEYYPTRTEASILQQNAAGIAKLTGPCELVELGSGSSTKTRILLDAYGALGYPLHYLPIDVSAGILEESALQLLRSYPTLKVHGVVSTFDLALEKLAPSPLPTRMLCFLGSTLGNLNSEECDQFFTQMGDALDTGAYFLLGVDLQKPKAIVEAAYNDSQEVTAAFNLNVLRHLNRKFGGDFDLTQFKHVAFYNEFLQQIEMHLESLVDQVVHLGALDLKVTFEAGETILTEISRKFNMKNIQENLAAKGLVPIQTWTDPNHWFGLLLCRVS